MTLRPYILSIFTATLLLSGCASDPVDVGTGVGRLSNDVATEATAHGMNVIRFTAVRDTAFSLGARGGLAKRASEINEMLEENERNLETIFNFHALMLDHSVLPPVLVQGRNQLNLADTNNIRVADRMYEIVSQARFVTAPPTWRSYLEMNFKEPDLPDATLLPKDRRERQIWQKYVLQGWDEGYEQADMIYRENLARIERDMGGMVLYRVLLAQGMVTPPYVAETHLGVTGGGDEMAINDRVLKITALPSLQSQGREWKTEITLND